MTTPTTSVETLPPAPLTTVLVTSTVIAVPSTVIVTRIVTPPFVTASGSSSSAHTLLVTDTYVVVSNSTFVLSAGATVPYIGTITPSECRPKARPNVYLHSS